MALDHYVPQVYLKQFYADELEGGRMHAFRKTDQLSFTPNSKSVCRIEEINTNEYLAEPRLIEDFLKSIEPNYNKTLSQIRCNNINPDVVFIVSGFVAYVTSCSPTAMRLSTHPAKAMLEVSARILDKQGLLDEPPESLGGNSFSELLNSRKLEFKVDEKYPQAIGIASILERVRTFGNFKWEILFNDHKDNPFLSSDFPIALEQTSNPMITCRVVPLSPDLAIRIVPDLQFEPNDEDLSFENFKYRISRPTKKEMANINKLIVRSAESLVFSCHNQSWLPKFIEENSQYRIESKIVSLGPEDEQIIITRQEIIEWDGSAGAGR